MDKLDPRAIVSKHTLRLAQPPRLIPSEQIPDAPLLGNGDIGIAIAGDAAAQHFYIGKNDFWVQAHIGEAEEARYERLINDRGRRTGTHIAMVGSLALEAEGLQGARYRYEIDLYTAEARGVFEAEDGSTAVFTSIVCACENLLITKVEWTGGTPLRIRRRIGAGSPDEHEVFSAECGLTGDVLYFRYAANPQNIPGRRVVAVASRAIGGAEAERHDRPFFSQSITTSVRKGECAYFVTAIQSDLNDAGFKVRSMEAVKALDPAATEDRIAAHRRWWDGFWSRSCVKLGNEKLEKWYYAGQYIIASAIRQGQPVPGLNGPWNTVDRPRWTGSYTLNYNYESPLWGLYTSNHIDMTDSYTDTLLAVMPLARRFAAHFLGADGIYLPVEIGPWGTICSMLFHNQKTYASYCCVNLFMRFYMTLDRDFAIRAFPFVEQAARFWESYLCMEDGRYVDEEDCPHEETIPSHCRNNPLALSLIRQTMRGALDMAACIGRAEDEHSAKWRDILLRLSDLPTIQRYGTPVVAYSAPGGRQWYERGGVGMWFVYPGNMVALDSDPALLALARNTFHAHNAWDDGNAFNTWYVVAARLSIDPDLVLGRILDQCDLHGWDNGVIWHGGGGIEDSSGVVSYVNEAMLQSVLGTIRLFPSWPKGLSAAFEGLRAYGAFLVSGAHDGHVVLGFSIYSEKGSRLRVRNPWSGGLRMTTAGTNETRWFAGEVVETDTVAGETYRFAAE